MRPARSLPALLLLAITSAFAFVFPCPATAAEVSAAESTFPLAAALAAIHAAPPPLGSDTTGDGSRERPFGTIQFAMDAAPVGGEVVLMEGTYHGAGNRDLTFRGKAMTVRSEAGRDLTIVTGIGPEFGDHRGFNFDSGETAESILEGITITRFSARIPNGYGTDVYYGAGIRMSGASPLVRDCVVSMNATYPVVSVLGTHVASLGGGISVEGGSPRFQRCSIVENVAQVGCASDICSKGSGGGIYARDANLLLEDCSISRNVATPSNGLGGYSFGGGIEAIDCELRLHRCTIADNRATYDAGVSLINGRTCISHCTVSGNLAIGVGYTFQSPPLGTSPSLDIEHCTIMYNQGGSTFAGGVVGGVESGTVTLCNTIVGLNPPQSGPQISINPVDAFHSLGGNLLSNNAYSLSLHETDQVSSEFAISPPTTLPNGHCYYPLPGSLSVDHGLAVHGLDVDQAGMIRACDGDGDGIALPDIGAAELQGAPCRSTLEQVRSSLLSAPGPAAAGRFPDPNLDGVLDVSDLVPIPWGCFP